MKKHLKAVISLLLAFVLFASAIPAGTINAFAEGKLSSKVTYEADGTAVVTLEAGDFYNAVRYTTDGSVPTKKSKLYVMPIEITEKTLIRAAEFDGDKKVKGIKLTVAPKDADSEPEKTESTSSAATNGKTGKITFKVTQLGNYKAIVELECETPDVEIRYTTDGSKPDEDSNLYENGIVIVENTKIRARAYKEGYKTTTTYGKTVPAKLFADFESEPAYNNDKDNDDAKETVKEAEGEPEKETEKESAASEKKDTDNKTASDKPSQAEIEAAEKAASKEKVVDNQKISYKVTYMDDGRTYVTLTPAKSGYTIRYTTDGTAPSKSSKKYSSRVKFEEPGILRARQYNSKGQCVGTIKIKVKIKCAPVTFTCVRIDPGTRTIVMETETPGATIYYTLDGTTPEPETAYLYTGPVVAGELADVKAAVYKTDYVRSTISWEIALAVPILNDNFDFSNPIYSNVANYINEYRIENGSNRLVLDEKLTEAANIRAIEIATYFDIRRPNGLSYTSVFGEYGLTPEMSMEHIWAYCENEEEFVNKLLSDDSVARSILGKGFSYNKIGVGFYDSGKAKYWVLQIIEE